MAVTSVQSRSAKPADALVSSQFGQMLIVPPAVIVIVSPASSHTSALSQPCVLPGMTIIRPDCGRSVGSGTAAVGGGSGVADGAVVWVGGGWVADASSIGLGWI